MGVCAHQVAAPSPRLSARGPRTHPALPVAAREGRKGGAGGCGGPGSGDSHVWAGVVLPRRLPRRLGVDAGDDMVLGVPARQGQAPAGPASRLPCPPDDPAGSAPRPPCRRAVTGERRSLADARRLQVHLASRAPKPRDPEFPPAARSSPPLAGPHQSQRRSCVAPPPGRATAHQ